METHILLERAVRRPYDEIPTLRIDTKYKIEIGYWTAGGTPIVENNNFDRVTKKCDQETGEDQKGE